MNRRPRYAFHRNLRFFIRETGKKSPLPGETQQFICLKEILSLLQDVELGNKQPTVEYLEYICFGLGVTLQEFFCDATPEDRLTLALRRLSAAQKERLAAFLETLS